MAERSALPVSRRNGALLSLLSGLLYFVAFPGVDVWPLAFVALVPLIVAVRGQTPRRAALMGWVAGFTMTMCGFYWLLEMLRTFSGFGTPLCLVFMAILCGYQAGRVALAGWLAARSEGRGWPAGPAFVLAFLASELVFPLLFPWTYAATVHQLPSLLQSAELFGPPGPVALLLCANFALAELVLARLERRTPRRSLVARLALGVALAIGLGRARMAMVDRAVAQAPRASVGLVQANMSLLAKRQNRGEGLRRHLEGTRKLLAQGPLDLVVWSETSVMAPVEASRASERVPREVTSRLGVPAVVGAVLVEPVNDEREYVFYNSALLSDATGALVGRYDKQFLLAFGEYLPFGETFPIMYRWSPHSGRFSPGTTLQPLALGDHGIATFICYEDISAGFVRSIVRSGHSDLLVNITNDAWFGDSTEPWIHLALSQLRAIEHRRFFVRSTNSGVSAVFDPVGRVVVHGDTFREEALRAEIAWLSPTTGYELWGNLPWWVVAAWSLVWAFRSRRMNDPTSAPSNSSDAGTTPGEV